MPALELSLELAGEFEYFGEVHEEIEDLGRRKGFPRMSASSSFTSSLKHNKTKQK